MVVTRVERRVIVMQQFPYAVYVDVTTVEARRERMLVQPSQSAQAAHVAAYRNARQEVALRQRWESVVQGRGAISLRVQDILDTQQRLLLGSSPWEIGPNGSQLRYVPRIVYDRYQELVEIDRVPFTYYLWAREMPIGAPPLPRQRPVSPSELYARPNLVPLPDSAVARPTKPMFLPTAPRREWRDPALVGVIATDERAHRGLWVLIGKWDEPEQR